MVPQVPLPAAHRHRSGDPLCLGEPAGGNDWIGDLHLADSVDQTSGRYAGLRSQEAFSTQLPTLNSLVVKNAVALQQLEANRAER